MLEPDQLPAILIPAYKPNQSLGELVKQLREHSPQQVIIVVDDGSGEKYHQVFKDLIDFEVVLLHHQQNQGKGEALKTGFKYWLAHYSQTQAGVVTADADGQHSPEDIEMIGQALAKQPEHLHLGSRNVSSDKAPWRSRFGNKLTRVIFRLVSKVPLQDTQTGLRGIPSRLIQHLLSCSSKGYEFELEMLLAATALKLPIEQVPIQTIYIDNNQSSHFKPLLDSMKVYFV